jgi:hypothetical protein
LVKLSQSPLIGLFSHFGVHNPLSDYFVFPFYLFLPQGAPSEVGATAGVAAVADKAFIRGVVL